MAYDRRRQKRVTVYRAELPEGGIWEVEYEAIADALHFACRDLREERRNPIEIVEDGVVIYDAEGIAQACRERQEAAEAERLEATDVERQPDA